MGWGGRRDVQDSKEGGKAVSVVKPRFFQKLSSLISDSHRGQVANNPLTKRVLSLGNSIGQLRFNLNSFLFSFVNFITTKSWEQQIRNNTKHGIPMNEETKSTLTAHLLRLLRTREYPKTICPSEVARAVKPDELKAIGVDSWRDLMPMVRELAWELRAGSISELEVLQGGQVVDEGVGLQDIRGPIRLRLRRDAS